MKTGAGAPPQDGQGHAHGAVTILNGTAGGLGCSLAVAAGTDATWTWNQGSGLSFTATPACDDRLARAVQEVLGGQGASVITRAAWPAERGLKTSSGAAAAMLRAARPGLADSDTLRLGVDVCRKAGVTITGALDDQAAVVFGGCQLADSRAGRIVRAIAVPAWHVAIWVPDARIPKSLVQRVDASHLAPRVAALAKDLSPATIPAAMTENGRLYTQLYEEAGLPVSNTAATMALRHGALGAGLSGCGPAVAALFDAPCELPPVDGGRWAWTKGVPA